MPRYLCPECALDFSRPAGRPGVCPRCGAKAGPRPVSDVRGEAAKPGAFGLSACPFEAGRFSGLPGLDARITPLR